jgi:hypothetical protein
MDLEYQGPVTFSHYINQAFYEVFVNDNQKILTRDDNPRIIAGKINKINFDLDKLIIATDNEFNNFIDKSFYDMSDRYFYMMQKFFDDIDYSKKSPSITKILNGLNEKCREVIQPSDGLESYNINYDLIHISPYRVICYIIERLSKDTHEEYMFINQNNSLLYLNNEIIDKYKEMLKDNQVVYASFKEGLSEYHNHLHPQIRNISAELLNFANYIAQSFISWDLGDTNIYRFYRLNYLKNMMENQKVDEKQLIKPIEVLGINKYLSLASYIVAEKISPSLASRSISNDINPVLVKDMNNIIDNKGVANFIDLTKEKIDYSFKSRKNIFDIR